jgi:hypothetical protein
MDVGNEFQSLKAEKAKAGIPRWGNLCVQGCVASSDICSLMKLLVFQLSELPEYVIMVDLNRNYETFQSGANRCSMGSRCPIESHYYPPRACGLSISSLSQVGIEQERGNLLFKATEFISGRAPPGSQKEEKTQVWSSWLSRRGKRIQSWAAGKCPRTRLEATQVGRPIICVQVTCRWRKYVLCPCFGGI